tara:strand:+ start:361 stop:2136 length:1776 start_codon:yes stop_codon:yes gene_type:complete
MAIKLNPGADASIVKSATASGLANRPGNYSKQFESIAQSYAETMESNTEMWKTIMDATLTLSSESIQKAGERNRLNVDVRNSPNAEALEAEINDIADELRKTRRFTKEVEGPQPEGTVEGDDGWMITTDESDDPISPQGPVGRKTVRNNPLSQENRDKRAALYKRRDAFYSEVAQMGAGLKVINNIQASGEFDPKATGAHGVELAEAFAASQTTGEHTKNGNYFESSYDRKKGKIIHTLMNDGTGPNGIPKGPVKDEDGNIRTYTTPQIQGVLIPKDPNLEPTYTKIFNAAEKNGKTLGTPWDEYQSNKAKKSIEPLIETSAGLHRSIHATFHHLDKSFYEEFTSVSELSAKEYAKLASVLPQDEKGNLLPTGVLRGVDGMSDGKPGIQQSDFANTQNQNRISLAMFDKGDKYYSETNLKNAFKEWVAGTDGKLGRVHNYGVGYNSKVLADKKAAEKTALESTTPVSPQNNTETDYFASVGDTKSLSLSGVFINKGELNNVRTSIDQRKGFPIGNNIIFNPKGKSGWVKIENDEIVDEYNSTRDLIKNGLKTSHPGFTSLINMDIDKDGKPDGPVNLNFLNKKYYDLIDNK